MGTISKWLGYCDKVEPGEVFPKGNATDCNDGNVIEGPLVGAETIGNIGNILMLESIIHAFPRYILGKCPWIQPQRKTLETVKAKQEEFYKLLPANKADHLCQLWQS